MKFLCDGRCQCEGSLCEDENEACPIDGPWDINSYPSEYPQYYKGKVNIQKSRSEVSPVEQDTIDCELAYFEPKKNF